MPKLSDLRNLCLYDDKNVCLGTLENVAFDKTSGKCQPVTDTGAYEAEKLSLRQGSVIALGAQPAKIAPSSGIAGKNVYFVTGEYAGTVENVAFGKNWKLERIICTNAQTYTRGRIAGAKDVIVIKSQTDKKPTQKRKVSKTETKKEQAVREEKRFPKRRYGDFNFLLGKTSDKNITNFYNEVMIKEGERITADTLRQAKLSGKLLELCLHAKYE